MHPLYSDFLNYLEEESKEKALNFVLTKLKNNEIDIVTLYNELFRPSLNQMDCDGPEEFCIWKEHVRSSIIRSLIENCYPYVIKERDQIYNNSSSGEKVMVVCPPEELHEIGPRMVVDFFTLCGFDVTFVGANTPLNSFISAIGILKPIYVAISVTNYYNLVATQKVIAEIWRQDPKDLKIIVGGLAFSRNPEVFKEMGADLLLQSFDDIKSLKIKGGA